VPATDYVLLVDDNELVRMAISKLLRRRGYPVLEAETGDVAVGLLLVHVVCVIVQDYVMPGGGLMLLQRFRAAKPEVPVILLTGLSSGYYDASQFDLVLEKPINEADLCDAIEALRRRA
jgi:two-component system cell cycle sensor histidine kinase/response regulator CckA